MTRFEARNLPTVADCEGCGACCLHMGYPTFIHGSLTQPDETSWTSLPAELKQQLQDYVAGYQPPPEDQLDGPCLWFDPQTRRCKHHAHRPQVCREFRVAGPLCLAWRKEIGVT